MAAEQKHVAFFKNLTKGRVISMRNLKSMLKFVYSVLMALIAIPEQAFAMMGPDIIGCGCGTFIIALFVINIMILVWVAKDAKARGMGSVGWLILMFFTGPIGLIVYFFARPKGDVFECSNCHNKRLSTMVTCPHCGITNTPTRQAEPPAYVQPETVPVEKKCQKCGTKVEPGDSFCENCGQPVS